MTTQQPEQFASLHTVQAGKRDAVTGIVTWGPVHVWERAYRLTWCGRRMKGIRQRGTRYADGVDSIPGLCPQCRRAIEAGRPRSFRR